MAAPSVDPRLRVLYLGAIAVCSFLVKDPRIALGLVVAHAIAWLALGHGARPLGRQFFKLWAFAAFVIVSYAITSEDPAVDRWIPIDAHFARFSVNLGGALVGVLMVLRVLTVVLASRIARTGDPRAIAEGLRKLHAPEIVATSIDAVLALLGGSGRGGGGGGGGGGGRGRRHQDASGEGFWPALKRIARGDVAPIVDRLDRQVGRVEEYLERETGLPRVRARDIAVIAGVSLTMLGIKALKVLPSVPFAPGHKLVILTPLYVVATLRTRTRAGATLTGLVMGTVAFLLGDGRYGIFEILKHVAPGIVCDLVVPLLVRPGNKSPGAFTWSLIGGVMGLGRFATIFTVTLAVQPPALAWAMLVPGLVIHTTFGILSGLVSSPLIRAVVDRTATLENVAPAPAAPPATATKTGSP